MDIDIVNAKETENGLYIWINYGGHERCILIPPSAIDSRKLVYGLAHLEKGEGDSVVIKDDVPDSFNKALSLIIAEHVGRIEAFGLRNKPEKPPKHDDVKGNRRDDLVKRQSVPDVLPKRKEPDSGESRVQHPRSS